MTTLIDLREVREATSSDLAGLQGYLSQLVGEPFRFARVSYGDELTLHFGEFREARSPRLKGLLYGAYILGLRASSWMLKGEGLVAGDGLDLRGDSRQPLDNAALEANPVVRPDSRVLSAEAFIVKPANQYALQLRMSDGGSVIVMPLSDAPEGNEHDALPEIADWELISPNGVLSAGPGSIWAFKPSRS